MDRAPPLFFLGRWWHLKGKFLLIPVLAALFLLAAPSLPAGAEIFKSATGATFYVWSDALVWAEGRVDPWVTVVRLPNGSLTTVPVERWAWDADCEAWSPGLAGRLDALLEKLVRAGLDTAHLRGLRVYLLPAYSLRLPGSVPAAGEAVAGVHWAGEGALAVAGLTGEQEWVFLHELGHYLAEKVLSAPGYGWDRANALGWEYLALRKYPEERALDTWSQARLSWKDRAAEWFAEDFAYWVAGKAEKWDLRDNYRAACDPPDEKVLGWFDGLFAKSLSKYELRYTGVF